METNAERFARRVGPHGEVSRRRVEVPAKNGIMAHTDTLVVTPCGREVQATLVTRRAERVRCPDCIKASVADTNVSQG